MSGFEGMDVEQTRAHAAACRDRSGTLDALVSRADSAVRGVTWDGPDHAAFLAAWDAEARTQLAASAETLRAWASELERQAEEQDAASDADGDGGALPGTTTSGEATSTSGGGLLDGMRDAWDGFTGYLGDRVDDVRDWWERDLLDPSRPWAETISDTLLLGADFLDPAVRGTGDLFGQDWALIDGRADVTVNEVRDITGSDAPRNMEDLVLLTDETRRTMPGSYPPGAEAPEFVNTDSAQIRIQTIVGADGQERYLVHVPPTQGEGLPSFDGGPVDWARDTWEQLQAYDAQGQPFGWPNNLYAMAGRENAGGNAVLEAMEAAGIPPGSEVMFSSHSQGGLVNSQLTADPAVNGPDGMYRVTESFSVGSPVDTNVPASDSTSVLNIRHEGSGDRSGDFVPGLDLEGRSFSHPFGNPAPNVQEAVFATPQPAEGFPDDSAMHVAHDSVQWSEDRTRFDPDSGYYGSVRNNGEDPRIAAMQERVDGRFLGPDVQLLRDVVVDVSRDPR